MRKSLILIGLLICAVASAEPAGPYAYHKFLTLADLFAARDSKSLSQNARAQGYILGLADKMSFEEVICVPKRTTPTQLTEKVYRKLLEVPPDFRYLNAGLLAYAALEETYPCPKP